MNTKDIEALRKDYRMILDELFEDNQSYTGPMSQEDALFEEVLKVSWNWITENFVPKAELKYVTGADRAYRKDYTILPSQHDEKVFAYDEPKYAGWYCPKCSTAVYSASEKDIAEHKCIKGI